MDTNSNENISPASSVPPSVDGQITPVSTDIAAGPPPQAPHSREMSQSITAPVSRQAGRLRQLLAPGPQLRLWPAVIILGLQWLVFAAAWMAPGTMVMAKFMAKFIAPMAAGAALVIWWMLFSRLRWTDRFLSLLVFGGAAALAFTFADPNFGAFGMILYALPTVILAWVAWLVVTPMLRWPVRRTGLLVILAVTWGVFTLMRMDGVWGDFSGQLAYRFSPTNEDKFSADVAAGKLGVTRVVDAASAKPLILQPGDWPGFRGAARDGRLYGTRIATDWDKNPPKLLWKHRVGPGWGSFAVIGTHLFTQEQRGENEVVVCYDVNTGDEIWAHNDVARFTEVVAGPGPRATPTFHDGKLYTLGAAGKLNCLNAATGSSYWSRDIVADSGAKVPIWGFASSPLVAKGVVTVFAGGPEGKSVLGYNADSGDLVWSAGEGQGSYCSLQPSRLGGVDQLVISTEIGLTAFEPTGGEILWRYSWEFKDQVRVVQPAILDANDVLLGTGFGHGTQRVHISRESNSWAVKEVWPRPTKDISPYFNDLVVHDGHLYGFQGDGVFFTCVDLANGKRKWSERGYGSGQVLLLADQGVLLITAESGEVALVEATPQGFHEIAKIEALADKTWNHPVVAHGKLFVRNGVEAACFQLTELPTQSP